MNDQERQIAPTIPGAFPKNPRPHDLRAVISHGPTASEWRELFDTQADIANAPEPVFLIDRFLQEESVVGIVGPVRSRKSIVTLNIVHALLTGEPLFGKFGVTRKPERVVYLCPETGRLSFAKRLRKMGLDKYVGKTLFVRTMNSEPVSLDNPTLREAAKGAVLVLDTMVRFFSGDENSSEAMKIFGDMCHSLIRDGVRSVLLLHHAGKSSQSDGKPRALTLESGRGSGDFGAFLTSCWGCTLDDFDKPHVSDSKVVCLKQRDFQAEGFKLSPSGNEDNFFLHYKESSSADVSTKREKAIAILQRYAPTESNKDLRLRLLDAGCGFEIDWIKREAAKVRRSSASGVSVVEGALP
ncbi:MAG: AAA family ATPase [Edaphobacter sp.]|uniref:AAA family ATPase n=1 Tax=Edaphobacter sp. TaxID=1934404 RepID=UPI00239B1BBD|nr:AAA family ATPase [Edaphobacter sp.]MDE1177804.1 AAA family ATPase [Edaphobacter sp.]